MANKHVVYTTPLPKKLGIKAETHLAVVAPPEGFITTLGEIPPNTKRVTANTSLALCFIRSFSDLEAIVDILASTLNKTASAWIIYPKTSRHRHTGFNENDVRNAGLAAGLVDYKVCSMDEDWSALKFAWRKTPAR